MHVGRERVTNDVGFTLQSALAIWVVSSDAEHRSSRPGVKRASDFNVLKPKRRRGSRDFDTRFCLNAINTVHRHRQSRALPNLITMIDCKTYRLLYSLPLNWT